MDATGAKWISIVVLGLVSFFLGMIPMKLASALRWTRHGCQRSPRSQLIISAMLCFGAGVLLATALIHMMPEVREHLQINPDENPILSSIPLAETLLAFGFFFVYGLDELVHVVLYRSQHPHHDHNNGDLKLENQNHGHSHTGHGHCPPAGLAVQEPRPSTHNSLLRQSAGQHHYGATECHGSHPVTASETSPLLEPGTTAPSMSVTSGVLALIALSIHAVSEGLAIGLQSTPQSVFFLLGAVATHKFVISFCLGMELSAGWGVVPVNKKFHVIFMIVFSGMSALGIAIGLLLMGSSPQGLLIQILQGLAAGTLLYVTFFEVLPRERAKCHAGTLQFFSVLAGFLVMLTLEVLVPHEDDLEQEPNNNFTTPINISGSIEAV